MQSGDFKNKKEVGRNLPIWMSELLRCFTSPRKIFLPLVRIGLLQAEAQRKSRFCSGKKRREVLILSLLRDASQKKYNYLFAKHRLNYAFLPTTSSAFLIRDFIHTPTKYNAIKLPAEHLISRPAHSGIIATKNIKASIPKRTHPMAFPPFFSR